MDERAGCTSDCGAPGSLLWERTFQGGVFGNVSALTVDACGSVIAAGEVSPSRYAGSEEIWLATYHADGELAWSVADRLSRGAKGIAVMLHDDGQIYVGGQAIVGGAGLASGQRKPVVRVYSSQGEGVQTHIIGEEDNGFAGYIDDYVDGLATDAQGGLLALTLLGRVWSIPPQGAPAETFESADFAAHAVATSPDGRRAVAGLRSGDASAEDGGPAALILVYDEQGAEAWRVSNHGSLRQMEFDSDGTLVVVEGSDDDVVTVRRYPASGEPVVVESVSLPSEVRLFAWAVDHRGRVLVGGDISDQAELRTPWVARLSATGVEWSWTRPGLLGEAWVQSLAVDAVDAVFVGARIDVSALSGMISSDIWMGRLAP